MKIYSKCQKCNKELQANTTYITRGEYAMRKGEFIDIRCIICNFDNHIHIDDFVARQSKSIRKTAMLILAGGIFLSIIIFLWIWFTFGIIVIAGIMFSLPPLAYAYLLKYDNDRVSTFNRLYAKR